MIPWINEGKHLCDQIQVELHDVEFEKQFINLFVHETITSFLIKRKINGSITIKSSNMKKKRHVGMRRFEVKLF